MGCVLPKPGYIQGLRDICDKEGIVFIMDEVMTGFRLAPGGAQERLGVNADLVTYGKVIGGGMPVGAFAGKKEIMQHIAPLGNVYQAGTLSGNPIAMTAGYTLLKSLKEQPGIYEELEDKSIYLEKGLREVLDQHRVAYRINRMGSMISLHFSDQDVIDFNSAASADIPLFNKYFHHLLNKGIYLPPSAFESWFLSNALSYKDLDETVMATDSFFTSQASS
jgi:glutamate-1-semialdehyde 2,1-aminomutase